MFTAILFAAAAGLGMPSDPQSGGAPVDCTSLPNPLYFPATTLLESVLAELSPALANPDIMGDDAMTVVHFPLSSCISYDVQREQTPVSGTAIYYTAEGAQGSCNMPTDVEVLSDLSAMDVGGATCLGGESPPDDLLEVPSYVETLGFVVPRNSTQTAITATEAYYILKFGGEEDRQVEPWTDPNFVLVRNPGSSTQLTIGANTGIAGTMWNGALRDHAGSSDVRDAVIAENTTGNAERVLGILNSSKWEAAADNMRVLAFEPFNGCLGALFPDSTSTSRDKRNVRDGHYPIWTNLRFILRTDANGNAVSDNGADSAARAQLLVDLMTGTAEIDGVGVAEAVIGVGNVPSCAMHVARDVDGGPIASFQHPAPCDCFFLEENGVDSGCETCSDGDTCDGGGECRFGFCEPA